MPWTAQSFKKHNLKATPHELRIGAAAANSALKKYDEGRAVTIGNAAIKRYRAARKKLGGK